MSTKLTNNDVPEWRSTESHPRHDGGGWAILNGGKVVHLSVQEVVRRLRGWHPLQPILVGAPGASSFMPPPEVPELSTSIRDFRKRSEKTLLALFVGSIGLFAAWLTSAGRAAPLYVLTGLLSVIAGFDYMMYLRHESTLSERARFYYWLQAAKKPRIGFACWTAVAVLMGGAQLLLEAICGTLDEVVTRYGTLFEPTRNGELWRLITGPFFHASLSHYLNNAVSLSFIGVVAWALVGPYSLAVFLIGNIVAAASQMLFGAAGFDSYLGVSGGMFALYGFVVTVGVIEQNVFPKGFTVLCVLIAAATVVGGEVLSANAGTIAHIAGALTGMCFGLGHALPSLRKYLARYSA